MGIVSEFRQLQKDVKNLGGDIKGGGPSGAEGVQTSASSGLYKSDRSGFITLGCTVYSSLSGMVTAHGGGCIKLTSGALSGAPVVPVKAGVNSIPLSCAVVNTAGTFSSPFLSDGLSWLPSGSTDSAAFFAIARYGNTSAIVIDIRGGGGVPSNWYEGTVSPVTDVTFSLSSGGELVIDVTKTPIKVIRWQ